MNLSQQYDKIYRYCFFHTRCQELAEDLTQETFLRYYQHPQYQSTGKELQYLYVIARNLCIDTYRKPSAEPLSEENMPVVSVQDDDFITHVALRNALSELTAEERELILLRYVNESACRGDEPAVRNIPLCTASKIESHTGKTAKTFWKGGRRV